MSKILNITYTYPHIIIYDNENVYLQLDFTDIHCGHIDYIMYDRVIGDPSGFSNNHSDQYCGKCKCTCDSIVSIIENLQENYDTIHIHNILLSTKSTNLHNYLLKSPKIYNNHNLSIQIKFIHNYWYSDFQKRACPGWNVCIWNSIDSMRMFHIKHLDIFFENKIVPTSDDITNLLGIMTQDIHSKKSVSEYLLQIIKQLQNYDFVLTPEHKKICDRYNVTVPHINKYDMTVNEKRCEII